MMIAIFGAIGNSQLMIQIEMKRLPVKMNLSYDKSAPFMTFILHDMARKSDD